MARRRPPERRPPPSSHLWGLVLVGGVGLFLLAIVGLGRFARQRVQDWDRYTLAFAELDCTPPPVEDRAEFLAEVRQRAGLPERLRLLDDGLAARLADAFAHHPWVETVPGVVVLPRRVQIQLVFRVPVLEVMLAEPTRDDRLAEPRPPDPGPGEEADWLVDGQGVLLPRKDFEGRLPLLLVTARPHGTEGQLWGDATVEAAAHTAAYLRPEQKTLGLGVFEAADTGLVLCTAAGSRVLWGQAPGAELAGEAPAPSKLQRLLDYCRAHGSLDQPGGRQEHDVRPREGPHHHPLPPPD